MQANYERNIRIKQTTQNVLVLSRASAALKSKVLHLNFVENASKNAEVNWKIILGSNKKRDGPRGGKLG